MARRTKAEAEQTRMKIVDAARHVFVAYGVAHSSLEQIAQAAGVTRGAVYWHFADKTQLFRAVWSQFPLGSIEESLSALQDNRSGDSLNALRVTLHELSETVLENKTALDTLRIVTSCGERMDAFASVSMTLRQLCNRLLTVFSATYSRAKTEKTLCQCLVPEQVALDTFMFTLGLVQVLLIEPQAKPSAWNGRTMIDGHIKLRRCRCKSTDGRDSPSL